MTKHNWALFFDFAAREWWAECDYCGTAHRPRESEAAAREEFIHDHSECPAGKIADVLVDAAKGTIADAMAAPSLMSKLMGKK